MHDQTPDPARPARNPFDWLGRDPRKLRGDLRTIRKAVRAGWLDEEPGRREKLMAALQRLDLGVLTPREIVQHARLYGDMDATNIRDEKEALREARRREEEQRPRVVIVQDMEAWYRDRASADNEERSIGDRL